MIKVFHRIKTSLKMETVRNLQYRTNSTLSDFNAISYVGRYWSPTSKNSTGRHFQNGRHNTAQIQHCSISTSWIDSRHKKISNGLHFQWSFYMKWRWNRTMLNLCGIVVAILKMATGRNLSMSGHHYLPTYKILMISDNVEFLPPISYAVFWQTSRKFWKLL
jgi:hypothetical protein